MIAEKNSYGKSNDALRTFVVLVVLCGIANLLITMYGNALKVVSQSCTKKKKFHKDLLHSYFDVLTDFLFPADSADDRRKNSYGKSNEALRTFVVLGVLCGIANLPIAMN